MTVLRTRAAIAVRAARATDAHPVADLLHESGGGLYERFMGNRDRALRVLRGAFEAPGTNASREVVWVAELESSLAAAIAAFPVEESLWRARAFLRTALGTLPPWRWPAMLWLYWAGARAMPSPPVGALYVDALATHPSLRRRGAARALLECAEREARSRGLGKVALETSLENKAARALYASAGFEEVACRPAARGLPGFVALVKELTRSPFCEPAGAPPEGSPPLAPPAPR